MWLLHSCARELENTLVYLSIARFNRKLLRTVEAKKTFTWKTFQYWTPEKDTRKCQFLKKILMPKAGWSIHWRMHQAHTNIIALNSEEKWRRLRSGTPLFFAKAAFVICWVDVFLLRRLFSLLKPTVVGPQTSTMNSSFNFFNCLFTQTYRLLTTVPL